MGARVLSSQWRGCAPVDSRLGRAAVPAVAFNGCSGWACLWPRVALLGQASQLRFGGEGGSQVEEEVARP